MEMGPPQPRAPASQGASPTLPYLVLHPAILHVSEQKSGALQPLLGLVCCSQDTAHLQESRARAKAQD